MNYEMLQRKQNEKLRYGIQKYIKVNLLTFKL